MWKKIFKYFVSASFVGLLLSGIGIYVSLRGTRTHLSMDVAAESNVLDVRHPVADLAILFEGRDIEEEKSNLKVLTIRVVNDGEANIRENDFDSRMPFGLQIDGGRIVRAQVAGSNSAYLSENLRPRIQSPDRIIFDKVIFDKGKVVALEVLLLHRKNINPRLRPLGKIAGLDEIGVTKSFEERDHGSLLGQVFSGAAPIQILRTIAYAVIALLSIVAIGFCIGGIVSIFSKWTRRNRRRIVASLPPIESNGLESVRKTVENIFINDGDFGLIQAERLLRDEGALKNAIAAQKEWHGGSFALDLTGEENRRIHAQALIPSPLRPFFEAKLIHLDGEKVIVDPRVEPFFADFLAQIKQR
jgi:hypothetical protein